MPRGVKYTREELEEAAKASLCIADVIRYFDLRFTGGTHSNFKRRLADYNIDTSHFIGVAANQQTRHRPNRKTAQEILILGEPLTPPVKTSRLRRALEEIGRPTICECGQESEWNGKFLQLQIDHINGLRWDNRPENLRYLCPNCHSQTDTFGSKNKQLSDRPGIRTQTV